MNPEKDTLPPAPPAAGVFRRSTLWPLAAIAALTLAGWQGFDSRQRLAVLEQQASQRQAEDEAAHETQTALREQIEALQARLTLLDERFDQAAAQNEGLRSLAQELSRGREESALLEAEQAITLAGQQLQLAGNVPVALIALQSADARLARLDQARVLPLRKALAKDIGRLNALPLIDVPGISLRLEQLILGIDKLPLAAHARPAETVQAPAGAEAAWWQRLGSDLWRELRSLVRIQRFDREAPALLAPGQEFFLRENLKLRLLSARLALLARDQQTYRNEVKVALGWLEGNFTAEDKAVQAARATLKQLAASVVDVEIPRLAETQAALRVLRPGKEKR